MPSLLDAVDEAVHVDRDGPHVHAHLAGGLEVALGIDRRRRFGDRAPDAAERRAQPLRRDGVVEPRPECFEQTFARRAALGLQHDEREDLLIAPARERDGLSRDLAAEPAEHVDRHQRRHGGRHAVLDARGDGRREPREDAVRAQAAARAHDRQPELLEPRRLVLGARPAAAQRVEERLVGGGVFEAFALDELEQQVPVALPPVRERVAQRAPALRRIAHEPLRGERPAVGVVQQLREVLRLRRHPGRRREPFELVGFERQRFVAARAREPARQQPFHAQPPARAPDQHDPPLQLAGGDRVDEVRVDRRVEPVGVVEHDGLRGRRGDRGAQPVGVGARRDAHVLRTAVARRDELPGGEGLPRADRAAEDPHRCVRRGVEPLQDTLTLDAVRNGPRANRKRGSRTNQRSLHTEPGVVGIVSGSRSLERFAAFSRPMCGRSRARRGRLHRCRTVDELKRNPERDACPMLAARV